MIKLLIDNNKDRMIIIRIFDGYKIDTKFLEDICFYKNEKAELFIRDKTNKIKKVIPILHCNETFEKRLKFLKRKIQQNEQIKEIYFTDVIGNGGLMIERLKEIFPELHIGLYKEE